MRVCLLSLLHCFPTPACPSCSLALILPVAAWGCMAPYGGSSSGTSHPSSGLPSRPLGWFPPTPPHPLPQKVPRETQTDLRKYLGQQEMES